MKKPIQPHIHQAPKTPTKESNWKRYFLIELPIIIILATLAGWAFAINF